MTLRKRLDECSQVHGVARLGQIPHPIWQPAIGLCVWGSPGGGTYRDEQAVGVFKLSGLVAHDLGQALHVADPHDADLVVEAEGLDQGEVDLQGDVALKVLVHGQNAEGHAVRVTAEHRKGRTVRHAVDVVFSSSIDSLGKCLQAFFVLFCIIVTRGSGDCYPVPLSLPVTRYLCRYPFRYMLPLSLPVSLPVTRYPYR